MREWRMVVLVVVLVIAALAWFVLCALTSLAVHRLVAERERRRAGRKPRRAP